MDVGRGVREAIELIFAVLVIAGITRVGNQMRVFLEKYDYINGITGFEWNQNKPRLDPTVVQREQILEELKQIRGALALLNGNVYYATVGVPGLDGSTDESNSLVRRAEEIAASLARIESALQANEVKASSDPPKPVK